MGEIKKPLPWVMGLMATGILVVGAAGYLAIAPKSAKIDLDKLTVLVQAQNLAVRITADGEVKPYETVNISPKVSGRLVQLRVEQGDRVQQGQILAIMEQNDLKAQFLQAQANLAQAQSRLQQAKAGSRKEEIAQAEARFVQAQSRLQQAKNGPRQEEIAQAAARLVQAQARLQQAKTGRTEEIAQAKARLIQAQARLAQAQVGNPSEINQAIAQVETARSRLNLAEKRIERNRYLAEQGAISQDRFDEIITEANNARAALFEAEQRLDQVRNTKNKNSPEIAQLEASVAESAIAMRQLQNGSRPEEIAQLEASAKESEIALKQLQNGSRPEEITQLEAAMAEAGLALRQQQNGSRPEEIAQFQSAVKAAEAQLLGIQVQLEDTIIRTPFAGIVMQKYAFVGSFVTPDPRSASTDKRSTESQSSILTIATEKLEVLAEVPEVDIGNIKTGMAVEIRADAIPDQIFKGIVRLIAPEAVKRDNVTFFEVKVATSPDQKELRSGMKVQLTLLAEPIKNAIVVPTVAIAQQNGQDGVWIPDQNNQPKFKQITIGNTIDDKAQIIDGLKEGERVFIELPPEFLKKQKEKKSES